MAHSINVLTPPVIFVDDVEPLSRQAEPVNITQVEPNNVLKPGGSDWFVSDVRTNLRTSPSLKRKSGEFYYYSERLDLEEQGRDRFLPSRVKLDWEVQRQLELYTKAFGTERILKACLNPLVDRELRNAGAVSKNWYDASVLIRRERLDNRPFTLLLSDPTVESWEDDFVGRLCLHLQEGWFKGVGGVEAVDTIITFGTTLYSLGQEDFAEVPAIRDGNVKFIYAAGGHMIGTTQGNNTQYVVKSFDCSTFALQTLCIPYNPEIDFISMAVPTYSDETKAQIVASMTSTHYQNRNYLIHGCDKALKGMLLLSHLDDDLSKEFVEAYYTGAQLPEPNEMGIIIAHVDGVASSDTMWKNSVASILAIHGTESVSLAACGFRMTAEAIFNFATFAESFFIEAKNKFIVMVYRLLVETDTSLLKLKEVIGDDVPLLGIQTYMPIMFHGDRFGQSETEEIEVALFLVSY